MRQELILEIAHDHLPTHAVGVEISDHVRPEPIQLEAGGNLWIMHQIAGFEICADENE